MTELQEARAKWLDAETRANDLQRENVELRRQLFEWQSKSIGLQTQLAISQSFMQAFCGSAQTQGVNDGQ